MPRSFFGRNLHGPALPFLSSIQLQLEPCASFVLQYWADCILEVNELNDFEKIYFRHFDKPAKIARVSFVDIYTMIILRYSVKKAK